MERVQVPQIKTVIPMTDSIFSNMDYDFGMIEASQLDILFYSNYGNRNISPVLSNLVTDFSAITDDEIGEISNLLLSIYRNKWDRYKDIYNIEYDRIHNYFDEYTENSNTILSENGEVNSEIIDSLIESDSENKTRTDDLSKNITVSSNESNESNDTSQIYGFNSTDGANSDKNIGTSETTVESTNDESSSGTQTFVNEVEKTRQNTRTVENSNITDSTKNIERTFTHKGNIGNLTTQELIRQDIKLWEWNFIESVLSDAKDLLTLPIYLG